MTTGRVETFVRQRIMASVTTLCSEIKMASGFNTSPDATNDPRELNGNEAENMLLIMSGAEEVIETSVGGCHQMELTITVYGYSQTDDGCPITENNKLLQDLRNMIHQNVATVAEESDRGLAFRLGNLETDEGALAHGGSAAFVQTFLFAYKNNIEW